MRSIAIRTLTVTALLCLGAKSAPKTVRGEKIPDRPPSGGRIRVQTEAWGSTWDWNQDPGILPPEVIAAIHRGLYQLGSSGTLERDLAESETASSDARVWTFRIRPGILWSDGQPLTAQHFIDGVVRALAPEVHSLPPGLSNIEGAMPYHLRQTPELPAVRVISERAFEVKLIRPDPLFTLKWLDSRLMPARGDLAVANAKSYGFEPEKMAFLGRMMLKDSRPGLRTLMVPNPRHPRPSSIPVIELWHAPDQNQARSLFERGHLDVALSTIPTPRGREVAHSVWPQETSTLVALFPQSKRAHSRSASLALSAAIDRKALAQVSPGITPSLDWVPPKIWKLQGMDAVAPPAHLETLSLESRPMVARGLLKQAGTFSKARPLVIASELGLPALESALQKNLSSALSIPVRLGPKPKADFVLRKWARPSPSIELYLQQISREMFGDAGWLEWNEIPLSDPRRKERYLEMARMALVEQPILIPMGFLIQEIRLRNYVTQPTTGTFDLASLAYDPASLARPRKKPQQNP